MKVKSLVKKMIKLRRLVIERKKEERRNNIVIKGTNNKPIGDLKEWVQKFIKDSLDLGCKMIS